MRQQLTSALLSLALAGAAPAAAGSEVEARIAARLRSFSGVMGVAATHLDTRETVAVDADLRFPTASAIKVAVMVEAFHQLEARRSRRDQRLSLRQPAKVGGSGVLPGMHAGSRFS